MRGATGMYSPARLRTRLAERSPPRVARLDGELDGRRLAISLGGARWLLAGLENFLPAATEPDSRAAGSQWHSFATSRPAVVAESHSQFGSLGASRAAASASAFSAPRPAFHSSGYAMNTAGSSRSPLFSSFTSASSFSSLGSFPNFESDRFANSRFGSSGFGTSSWGSSGSSLLASSLSAIPNLLFGGLLHIGSAALGGWVTLGETALSLALRAIDFGLSSNGSGQAAFAGDPGVGPNGFAWNSGFAQVPAGCNSGPNFRTPEWTLSAYCVPYPRYSLGQPASGDPNFGYNFGADISQN